MAKPSLKASQNGIEKAKQALIIAGWTQKDLNSQIGCSRQPITNFFKGEAIEQSLFRVICDRLSLNWQEIIEVETVRESKRDVRIDLGEIPNFQAFYGRTEELTKLKQWILKDRCQLVSLLGIRGIGKTTLAAKFVEESKNEFDRVIWRSLNDQTPLATLLVEMIKFLSPEIGNIRGQKDIISLLMEYLRKHRCLLVLDNAESLMQNGCLSGQYQEDYKDYGKLLKRLGTEHHQSCLILTSRENPQEIVELETRDYPVHTLNVLELPENDAFQLLKSKGLSDEEHWGTLIKLFQGNILALQLVSGTIKRSFGGKVSHFLKQTTITTRQIVDLLDRQFESLSDLEREIMYCLAKQQSMSFADLKENSQKSGAELLSALESLLRRSLIQGKNTFKLDPVVQEYIIGKFAQEKSSLDSDQAEDNVKQLLERCYQKI